MNKFPLVSVVVSTRNSQKYLKRALQSIKKQTYKNWELIVVDNFSADKTVEIAKKFTKKVFRIGPERSTQYNFAVKKSHGKYIYRIDSDFVVEPNVITECVEKCERDGLDAIAVHNTSDPTVSFWSRVRKLERDCYVDDDSIVAVRFVKKAAFDKIGGFDERMFAGEDYDLHNRLIKKGFKWGRIKSKEMHLGEVTSIWLFAKQSFRYGRNLVYYMDKYKELGQAQMTPIRGAYFRHWKQLVTHPILTLGLIFMNLVKFTAGGLGGIFSLIERKL